MTADYPRTEWDRAVDALRDAHFLLANGGFDGAASRAYYAAFHAVTALFALEGQIFAKHYERKIIDRDAQNAAAYARQLLRGLGLHDAAERVGDLALPPSIAYVADLRKELVAVARRRATIPYDRVLERLKLPENDFGYRQLYR